jgi:hypothetical protein
MARLSRLFLSMILLAGCSPGVRQPGHGER